MGRLIDVDKQLVRLYRLNLSCGDVIMRFLVTADTVDAEPVRHGHWIYKGTWETFECSVCGRGAIRNDYPYCMWCGAKMDEVEDGR